MTSAARSDPPWFAFEQEVSPVPLSPTHCTSCGKLLEPLRRYAGLCKECVASRSSGSAVAVDKLRSQLVLLRSFYRQRSGHRERYVEVRCSCGRKCRLQWARWVRERPHSCNRCRLRGIDARGFEPELAR
jgi:hypothetical protein